MNKRLDLDIPTLTTLGPDALASAINLPASISLGELPSLPSISLPSMQSLGSESLSNLKKATKKATMPSGAIVGIVAAIVVLLLLVALLGYIRHRKLKKRKDVSQNIHIVGNSRI
jgi:ABC-type multidrug transport system permease subunit